MKLITVDANLVNRFYRIDEQVMLKDKRPVVLIVRLKFRGLTQDFAVPLRSNIPPAAPRDEYFALPPRKSTKPKHHHGLHYIKMFPVSKRFYVRYRIEGDIASNLYLAIIDKNEKHIVDACQAYLDRYAQGIHPPYATDIEKLIDELKAIEKK